MNALQCRPALGGASLAVRAPNVVAPRRALVIQNAHKKGAGSTKNGRDSNPKFRGVKVYGGQPIHPGGIIVRQLGNKFHPGNGVGCGKDFTLFSVEEGVVVFEVIKRKKCVSVYPADHVKAQGFQLQRQPGSRASKRIEEWKGVPRNRDA
eukprot:jgi/Ulvmu1/1361/UM011_0089.1